MDRADETLSWLLAGDPAVRWQVHRDLLDADTPTVTEERALVADEGWGAPSGRTGSGRHLGRWALQPEWTSTTYTLLLLRQLGLPSGHPQARAGCERLLNGARWYGGGLTYGRRSGEPEACITSLVVSIDATFRVADERVADAVGWLLAQQLGDGGWNCESLRRGSVHGSFHTTILALEALREWQTFHGADARVTQAAARGREFFLGHHLYRSHRTGKPVSSSFTRLVFPPGWHHDVLRGLDYFQSVSAQRDDRLAEAVEVLESRQRADGTWPAYRPHPGRYWFDLEVARQPSRVNTMRALRVMRW